jgi:hypothetical protein
MSADAWADLERARVDREPDRRGRIVAALSAASASDGVSIRGHYVALARAALTAERAELERLEAMVRAHEDELRRRLDARQLEIPGAR